MKTEIHSDLNSDLKHLPFEELHKLHIESRLNLRAELKNGPKIAEQAYDEFMLQTITRDQFVATLIGSNEDKEYADKVFKIFEKCTNLLEILAWKEQFREGITKFVDYLDMAEQMYEIQPFYFDQNKIWWVWNKENKFWEMIDDVDLMNVVDDTLKTGQSTTAMSTRSQIIESLKRIGRKKAPVKMPDSFIQFKDVLVDVLTGNVEMSSPKYFATNPIPWALGESEETPQMDLLFEQWVGKEFVTLLYEIISYCLLPSYPLHRIFCLNGSGSNGKSKYLNLIIRFIGQKNSCASDLDTLIESRFESANLYKKLICTMGETNFNALKRTQLLKKLTGEDLIGFEFKSKSKFTDYNYAKILIATNSLPLTHDKTIGFYRRWLIIDFPNQFAEGPDILKKIPNQEYLNLANKCVKILPKLLSDCKFTNEGSIEDRRKKYEDLSNPLHKFLKEFCEVNEGGQIFFFELYNKLFAFLKQNNYRELTKKEVGQDLDNEGFEKKRTSYKMYNGEFGQATMYLGLKWKEGMGETISIEDIISTRLQKMDAERNGEGVEKNAIMETFPNEDIEKILEIMAQNGQIYQNKPNKWKNLV